MNDEQVERLRELAARLREDAALYGFHDDETSLETMNALLADADALDAVVVRVERLRGALEAVQPYVKAKYGIPDEVCDAVDAAVVAKQPGGREG